MALTHCFKLEVFFTLIVSIACCMLYHFSSYLTLNNHDLEKVTESHSNWYYSKAWVRFPIRLP